MALTHSDIAPAANRGEAANAGNLYTHPGAPRSLNSWLSSSWMPRTMGRSLDALADLGIKADQTIWSFNTPIALRYYDADGEPVWIMAETNYSSRTGQQINKLMPGWARRGLRGRIERVPSDVSPLELRRIIAGLQRFVPGHGAKVGHYVPGPNYTAGA